MKTNTTTATKLSPEQNGGAQPQAIFEQRENMGASPLAIEYTEHIMRDLAAMLPDVANIPWRGTPRIAIAALVDAAIRKSGAPDLLAALVGMVFARLGGRTSAQGHDKWRIWADQYRNDPKVDLVLLRAVDAITKSEVRPS